MKTNIFKTDCNSIEKRWICSLKSCFEAVGRADRNLESVLLICF